MDEKDLARPVQFLLEELSDAQRHLPTIASDFRECGIDTPLSARSQSASIIPACTMNHFTVALHACSVYE